jgi:hypothetical protein
VEQSPSIVEQSPASDIEENADRPASPKQAMKKISVLAESIERIQTELEAIRRGTTEIKALSILIDEAGDERSGSVWPADSASSNAHAGVPSNGEEGAECNDPIPKAIRRACVGILTRAAKRRIEEKEEERVQRRKAE